MNGHLKSKQFDKSTIYVVNHELNTIYNDLKKFNKDEMENALTQFQNFKAQDTTIMVRGSDGKIIKKRGDDLYVAQNLAYLYNDSIVNGQIVNRKYNYQPD